MARNIENMETRLPVLKTSKMILPPRRVRLCLKGLIPSDSLSATGRKAA